VVSSQGLEAFRGIVHGYDPHGVTLVYNHDLSESDGMTVHQDIDGLARQAVEIDHGALTELEQLLDAHPRSSELHGHLKRNIEKQLESVVSSGFVLGSFGHSILPQL
jgi:hypothetical protein